MSDVSMTAAIDRIMGPDPDGQAYRYFVESQLREAAQEQDADRDRWRARADALAAALRLMCCPIGSKSCANSVRARAALREYEEEGVLVRALIPLAERDGGAG